MKVFHQKIFTCVANRYKGAFVTNPRGQQYFCLSIEAQSAAEIMASHLCDYYSANRMGFVYFVACMLLTLCVAEDESRFGLFVRSSFA